MARWRLTNKHYLNVPGTEWEHKETSRETGKQVRKLYPVPMYLDPEDPSDWNYRQDASIIVAYEGSKYPRDIIFVGPPTPDMEPLDDEAVAITEAERPKWVHPIESLEGNYGKELLSSFERELDAAFKRNGGIPQASVSAGQVSAEDFAKLMARVEELAAANAQLQAQLAEKPTKRV